MIEFLINISWDTVFQGGTLLVAMWGAVLSTYILLDRRRRNRPRIKVDVKHGAFGYSGGGVSEEMIFVTAMNLGEKHVHLTVPCFRLSDGRLLILADPLSNEQFPYDLAPGKSCDVWFSLSGVKKALLSNSYQKAATVRGLYRDVIGNKYLSSRFVLDLGGLSNASTN